MFVLSLSLSVSLCLSVSVSVSLCLSLSLCLCPSLSVSLSVSVGLYVYLSITLSVCLCPSACLSVSVSVCLYVCLSVCLSLSLSLSLFLSLSLWGELELAGLTGRTFWSSDKVAVFSSISECHQLKLRYVLRTGHLQTFGGFFCFCFEPNPPQEGKDSFKKASLSSQRWCHGALHSREPDTCTPFACGCRAEPRPKLTASLGHARLDSTDYAFSIAAVLFTHSRSPDQLEPRTHSTVADCTPCCPLAF